MNQVLKNRNKEVKLSNLLNFLTGLVTDTQKQRAFANDSEAVMDAAGLSEVDKIALKSGDRVQIDSLFTEELPQISCSFFEPNPDPLPDPDPFPFPPPPDSDPPEESMQAIAYKYN